MPNIDISRSATNFDKHYHGVRMQQGRVLTDDDFNEAARLAEEDARRAIVDMIGSAGSPDDGFKLCNTPHTATDLTNYLALSPGTFFLGGHRLEVKDSPVQFAQQQDWLQGPDQIPTSDGTTNLIYIETWQQSVTAVEDNELLEVALGGPDTSARIKTMWRAKALRDSTIATCADAWNALKALGASGDACGGDSTSDNCEVIPQATLTVSKDAQAPSGDLCSPQPNGGYLGAENQAIRVQIFQGASSAANVQFLWSYDNGSPLYRVQALRDSSNALTGEIQMLSLPKDQAHWALKGQVVEFLPWSAVLPNGEKIAEQTGKLATALKNYDPNSKSFLIDLSNPINADAQALLNNGPVGSMWSGQSLTTLQNKLKVTASDGTLTGGTSTEDIFFYMRVWNRGADNTALPLSLDPTTKSASLVGTGLKVTFSGTRFRAGDYWIIAARPNTPSEVVPWELTTGRKPNGVRRWIAPLGIVQWDGNKWNVISDCRPRYVPLARDKGCCTYTVGCGGLFATIQAAINALPQEGGEVCILPGTYIENVVNPPSSKQYVKIHGCGASTKVLATTGTVFDFSSATIATLVIEKLSIVAVNGSGLILTNLTSTLKLTDLLVVAEGGHSAIKASVLNASINQCGVYCTTVQGGTGIELVTQERVVISNCTVNAEAGVDLMNYPGQTTPMNPLAALIEGNSIIAASGLALRMRGRGSMSVIGNELISRGLAGVVGVQEGARPGTVSIVNYGVTSEYPSLSRFDEISKMTIGSTRLFSAVTNSEISPSGNILFSGNRVMLELPNLADSIISILIGSLDDVGFFDNVSECRLPTSSVNLLSNTFIAGWSVRMSNNRMKEGPGVQTRSSISLGIMNTTTNNQGTHCFFVYGPRGWMVDQDNSVLWLPTSGSTTPTADGCRQFVVQHQSQGSFFAFDPINKTPMQGMPATNPLTMLIEQTYLTLEATP